MSGDLDHVRNDDFEAIATLFPFAVLAGETPLNVPPRSTRSTTKRTGCVRRARTSTGCSTPTRFSGPPDACSLGGRRCNGPSVEAPKVGRNDPCPCVSGKKYKKCCLRAVT
jgi:hypothetical protein